MNLDGSSPNRQLPAWLRSGRYGMLEYGIIIGFVGLIVLFTSMIFGGDVRVWLQSLIPKEKAQFVVVVQEKGQFVEILEQEVISVSNCDGTQDREFEVERERRLEHIILFPFGFPDEHAAQVSQRMGEQYGFQDGQLLNRLYKIQISAASGSTADYTIEWQEDWREGIVMVQNEEGITEEYPYQVLNTVEFAFLGSQEKICGQ